MDLNSFLQKYPQLKLLQSPSDNHQVLELMERSPMRLGFIDLLYDRAPNFQALLQAQGEHYLTLLSMTENNKVSGCFSVSTTTKYIDGKKKSCAYIGDFRTNGDRRVALLWRTEYQQILNIFKNAQELNKPEYFLTAVLKKNKEAIRNLTSAKKDFGFYYHFLCEKNMVNVFGKWPMSGRSVYEVQSLNSQDFIELRHFLDDAEKKKQFGSVFDSSKTDALVFREKYWPEVNFEKFLIIKNSEGKMAASCLLWNPKTLKQMSVSRMGSLFEKAIKLLNKIGLNLPIKGQSLETIYMTHLNVDKSVDPKAAVSSFLNQALEKFPKAHMVSFSDDFGVYPELDDYIKQSTAVLLYEVSTNKKPSFRQQDSISFEMSLV